MRITASYICEAWTDDQCPSCRANTGHPAWSGDECFNLNQCRLSAGRRCVLSPLRFMMFWLALMYAVISPALSEPPDEHEIRYLTRFGYLSGPSQETGNLRSYQDASDAIKKLQKFGGIPVTGVFDLRTKELMLRPRCGNEDVTNSDDQGARKKRYILGPSKWEKKDLTFRILNYTPDLGVHKAHQAIYDAFKVWSDVTQLTFTEVMNGDADIMIRFASQYHEDGYPFDGEGTILAHAFYPGAGRGGDTHFDEDESWTSKSTDEGIDLFMVAAHEFGHGLGLSHSEEQGALMYPWYPGFVDRFRLPRDDVLAIQRLYGYKDQPRLPDLPPTTVSTRSGRPEYSVAPPTMDPRVKWPNPCSMKYDAITVIRGELMIFSGKWFWRVDNRGMAKNIPVEIQKFWPGLPPDIENVDAVFEQPLMDKIVFFKGDKYWILRGNHLLPGHPKDGRPITEFNIPRDVKKIDAVFVWGYNHRTYLVSGDMYWKLAESSMLVEYDYPRDMSIWKHVPVPLDSAFTHKDGITYFFQDKYYWSFNNDKMKVRRGFPKLSGEKWMGCSPEAKVYRLSSSAPQLALTGLSCAVWALVLYALH